MAAKKPIITQEKEKINFWPGFPELDRYDVDKYPSYTNLCLPYCVVCRQRYSRCHLKHTMQFEKELKMIEMMQSKALDGVRIHREFTRGIISPLMKWKYQRERANPDPLTPRERWHLEEHVLIENITS